MVIATGRGALQHAPDELLAELRRVSSERAQQSNRGNDVSAAGESPGMLRRAVSERTRDPLAERAIRLGTDQLYAARLTTPAEEIRHGVPGGTLPGTASVDALAHRVAVDTRAVDGCVDAPSHITPAGTLTEGVSVDAPRYDAPGDTITHR